MLKRSFVAFAFAAGLGLVPYATLHADTQGQKPPVTSPASTTVHFEGCLFTEPSLTATTPIVVPAGVPQTWVLTGVKVIAGAMSDADVAKRTFTLAKVDDPLVHTFYGKRVGVVGRVGAPTEHPTLEVISIREISGGCPVLPSLT